MAFERRGSGTIPAAADLEFLVESFGLVAGKRSPPSGLGDPFGPSTLLDAFYASIATARTVMALKEGTLALARRSGILTWSLLALPDIDLAT